MDSGFQTLLDSGFHIKVDSGFQSAGFRIPIAKISWIPDSGFCYMGRSCKRFVELFKETGEKLAGPGYLGGRVVSGTRDLINGASFQSFLCWFSQGIFSILWTLSN